MHLLAKQRDGLKCARGHSHGVVLHSRVEHPRPRRHWHAVIGGLSHPTFPHPGLISEHANARSIYEVIYIYTQLRGAVLLLTCMQ